MSSFFDISKQAEPTPRSQNQSGGYDKTKYPINPDEIMIDPPSGDGNIKTPDSTGHAQQSGQRAGGLHGKRLKKLAPNGMRKRRCHPARRTRIARALIETAGGFA